MTYALQDITRYLTIANGNMTLTGYGLLSAKTHLYLVMTAAPEITASFIARTAGADCVKSTGQTVEHPNEQRDNLLAATERVIYRSYERDSAGSEAASSKSELIEPLGTDMKREMLVTKFVCANCNNLLEIDFSSSTAAKSAEDEPTGAAIVTSVVGVKPCAKCYSKLDDMQRAVRVLMST